MKKIFALACVLVSCNRGSNLVILPLVKAATIVQDNRQRNVARLSYLRYGDQPVIIDSLIVNPELWDRAQVTWKDNRAGCKEPSCILQSSHQSSDPEKSAGRMVTHSSHKGTIRLESNNDPEQESCVGLGVIVSIDGAPLPPDEPKDRRTGHMRRNHRRQARLAVGENGGEQTDDTEGRPEDQPTETGVEDHGQVDGDPAEDGNSDPNEDGDNDPDEPSPVSSKEDLNKMEAKRSICFSRKESLSKIAEISGKIGSEDGSPTLVLFVDGYSGEVFFCWSEDGEYLVQIPLYRHYDVYAISTQGQHTIQNFEASQQDMELEMELQPWDWQDGTSYQLTLDEPPTPVEDSSQARTFSLQLTEYIRETKGTDGQTIELGVPSAVFSYDQATQVLHFHLATEGETRQHWLVPQPRKQEVTISALHHSAVRETVDDASTEIGYLGLAVDTDSDGLPNHADLDDDNDKLIDSEDGAPLQSVLGSP